MLSIYEIAFHLKIPIYKLAEEMTYEELLGWFNYFERRPIGWREDLRTSYQLQVAGDKRRSVEIFPTLSVIFNKPGDGMSTLKNSALFQKMLSAVGGSKLEV
jgi:hypothetical protein